MKRPPQQTKSSDYFHPGRTFYAHIQYTTDLATIDIESDNYCRERIYITDQINSAIKEGASNNHGDKADEKSDFTLRDDWRREL
mgnify:CR=1 FL=1